MKNNLKQEYNVSTVGKLGRSNMKNSTIKFWFTCILFVLLFPLWAFFNTIKAQPIANKKPILEYTETNIEGCQYLVCRTYMGFETLCHKGNCTNHVVFKTNMDRSHEIYAYPIPHNLEEIFKVVTNLDGSFSFESIIPR